MTSLFSLSSLALSIMALMSLMGNALCQDPSKKTLFPRGYYDDVPFHDVAGFIFLFTVALTFTILALFGIVFVLVRLYVKWKDTGGKMSMALRVPLYLGILNSIMWVFIFINFTYPAIYHTTFPGNSCKIVAGISVAFTLLERFMAASIAITIYLRVCRRIYWNYGKYDWKLWFISGLIAILLTAASASLLGPTAYWCGAKRSSPLIILIGLGTSILILLICAYCYVRTVLTIRAVTKQISGNARGQDNVSSDVEVKVTKKVMGYVLVFIIQWFPAFPYDIYGLLGRDDAWVYALVAASINMGSIGNAICFVVNEGWGLHGNNSSLNETDHMSTTAVSSISRNMGGSNFKDNDDTFINSAPLHECSTVVEISQGAVTNDNGIKEDFVGV